MCKDIIQKNSSDHINVSTFIGALLRQVKLHNTKTELKNFLNFQEFTILSSRVYFKFIPNDIRSWVGTFVQHILFIVVLVLLKQKGNML